MKVVKSSKATAEKKEEKEPTQRKATYEELNNYCIQLMQQNKTLVEQLKQRDMATLFKRIDYLFLVVSNRAAFPADFVNTCVEELMNQLTIQEEAADSKEENHGETAETK